jgi:hypothetical protein
MSRSEGRAEILVIELKPRDVVFSSGENAGRGLSNRHFLDENGDKKLTSTKSGFFRMRPSNDPQAEYSILEYSFLIFKKAFKLLRKWPDSIDNPT